MALHTSILALRIPWTEETGRPWDHKELDRTECLSTGSLKIVSSEKRSVQENNYTSFQEAVMQMGSGSQAYGTSDQVVNETFLGKQKKTKG